MEGKEVIVALRSMANEETVRGMARYGISTAGTLGVPLPAIRGLARQIGRDHPLALELWNTGIHEARILAGLVEFPSEVGEDQAEKWAGDFDSWDVCDQTCNNLLRKTSFAFEKAVEWAAREEEFVKRAGFVLMACLAVHEKRTDDHVFSDLLALVEKESGDPRNFVKKAVNWALRQIGKRSRFLNEAAVSAAERLIGTKSPSARWIGSDALRELRGEKVQARLKERA